MFCGSKWISPGRRWRVCPFCCSVCSDGSGEIDREVWSEGNVSSAITMSAGFTEDGVLSDDTVSEMLAQRQALTQMVPDEPDVLIMLNAGSVDSVQIPSDAMALLDGAGVSMFLPSTTVALDSDTVGALPSGGLELSIGEDVLNQVNVNKVKDPIVLDIDLSSVV